MELNRLLVQSQDGATFETAGSVLVLGRSASLTSGGANVANVSIGPNPIRNAGLGTLGLSSPNAAAIVVSGPASRVTISAP